MPERDFVYELANHLLPEDWQVALEPSTGRPIDEVVVEEIKRIYPKCISTPTQKWRNKRRNRKCYFCRNCEFLPNTPWNTHELVWCKAKKQSKNSNTKRYFCKLFELKENQ